jgi:hypothetical protein
MAGTIQNPEKPFNPQSRKLDCVYRRSQTVRAGRIIVGVS